MYELVPIIVLIALVIIGQHPTDGYTVTVHNVTHSFAHPTTMPITTFISSVVDGYGNKIIGGGSTSSTSITFTFRAVPYEGSVPQIFRPVSAIACSLDGGNLMKCGIGDGGAISYSGVSRYSTHTFQVTGVDNTLSLITTSSASFHWSITSSTHAPSSTPAPSPSPAPFILQEKKY
jgi:hypothetical protein